MDGLKMQTALRMKKNAAEKRCDYYSDKNTKVMMIEEKKKKKLAKLLVRV